MPTSPADLRVGEVREGFSRVDTIPDDAAARLGQRKLAPGEVIGGRYRLLTRLKGGGMGEVYAAENESIGLKVAVKLIKAELLADSSFRQRFQREAQAIATVIHPNVARFLDLVVGDPTFLVMEHVDGVTLAERLAEKKRLDAKKVVELARPLCAALHAAHAKGVIHRDLKPSNIMLTLDERGCETPKLIDFGLAKIARPNDESLTRAGQVVGTPTYMSPEQSKGGPVDGRSDIYSLGCLLYELIAGRPPFRGDEDLQILYKHVHETPPPLRALAPETPPGLAAVIARALEKNAADRFQTMDELADALALSIESAPPAERRVPPIRWVALALLLVTSSLVGFGVGARRLQRAAGGGGVVIVSDPAGAAVEIDGVRQGETTPTLVRGISDGEHRVRLSREGHAEVERRISARAGERLSLEVVMPPKSRQVEVKTSPPGGSVFLDGNLVLGVTPLSLAVVEDDFHELRIERDGFETLTHALKPESKEPVLQFELQPENQPRGTVVVDANGAAEVWLDGVFTGLLTPTLGFRVPTGQHTIQLRGAGGLRSALETIDLHQGQTIRLTLAASAGKPE